MLEVETLKGLEDMALKVLQAGEDAKWTQLNRILDDELMTDKDGNRLLDGVSGLFTTQIGYSHGKEIGEAAAAARWVFELDPGFAPQERGSILLGYKMLGFAATERLVRVQASLRRRSGADPA